MKCQKCGKNESTILYRENNNGHLTKLHLCSECANKENLSLSSIFAFSLDSFASPWTHPAIPSDSVRKCSTCNLTLSALQKTGRVGCGNCYDTFADVLEPYIKKFHGATRHIPLAYPPQRYKTEEGLIDKLRLQLHEAISLEEYEQAARLRDEIRRLEGEST